MPDRLDGDGAIFTREVGRELGDYELETVIAELETQARMDLVAFAAKQMLRDLGILEQADFYPGNDGYDRIVSRADDYIAAVNSRQAGLSEDSELAILKLEVQLNRDKLMGRLAELAVIETSRMRTILTLRKFSTEVDEQLTNVGIETDDLTEKLSGVLFDRGFEPQLWKDLSLQIASDLDRGHQAEEQLLMTFVVDSDWRDAKDERYEMPLLILRQHGRMLNGLTILELVKRGTNLYATIRLDVYDLFNGRSLGTETFTGQEPLDQLTRRQSTSILIDRVADEAISWAAGRMQEVSLLEARGRNKDYSLTCIGFDAQQRNEIEGLLVRILAEDAESSNSGGVLSIDFTMSRSTVVVRQEIERTLRFMGFEFEPVEREGNAFTVRAK
ncbi:MAG: hypothetical protein ACI8Q9_001547 [Planctomycetota bacterium]|jgi:hypothetical protein